MNKKIFLLITLVLFFGELFHFLLFYRTYDTGLERNNKNVLLKTAHEIAAHYTILLEESLKDKNRYANKHSESLYVLAEDNRLWQITVYEKHNDRLDLLLTSEFSEYFANGSKEYLRLNQTANIPEKGLFKKIKNTKRELDTLIFPMQLNNSSLLLYIQQEDLSLYKDDSFLQLIKYLIGTLVLYILLIAFWYKKLDTFIEQLASNFKRSYKHISENRRRDKKIKDSIEAGAIFLDSKLNVSYANKFILKRLGLNLGEIISKPILNYVEGELRFIFRDFIFALKEKPNSIKIKTTNAEGSIVHFLVKGEHLPFEMENARKYLLILEDITEITILNEKLNKLNKNLEKKIVDRVKYTRSILDSQSSLIFVCNNDRIVDANRSFLKFFGNFRSINDFNNTNKNIFALFEKTNEEGFVYDFEHKDLLAHLLVYKNRKHKVKIRLLNKIYIFDISADYLEQSNLANESEKEYFIVTLVDITEFELLREEEINLAKLTSVGKLTAGITHEINTPLTYIKGNLEIAKLDLEDIQDQTIRNNALANISTLEDGVKRIENIIKSMQEFVGNKKTKREKIEIVSSILLTLKMLHNRSKHITAITILGKTFDISMDEESFEEKFYVEGFKQKLEQVWIIILNNALDELTEQKENFEERKLELVIDSDDNFAVIQFIDNAGGIDSTMMDKIFDPLVSTKTSSGMGMGLSIAKKIIEEHRGEIRAYNKNDGAVFEIRLRLS